MAPTPTEHRGARPDVHEDAATIATAIAAGAHGYLVKGACQEDILRALRAVAAGDMLLARSRRRTADQPSGHRERA
jgi:DNA-binding NarL/FixJ family response regulator